MARRFLVCLLTVGFAAATAGCLEAVTYCADESYCPAGAMCAPGGGCVDEASFQACTGQGVADGATCTLSTTGQSGTCLDGLCNLGRCGDGLLEPRLGEVCDYGATAQCSRDCLSTLSCGNGIVDFAVGEGCDDGNLTSLDGCSRNCQAEAWHWLEGGLPQRIEVASAHDPLRGQTVLFGGASQEDLSDTTTIVTGTEAYARRPLHSPGGRQSAAMTFDANLGRILLFGGTTIAGAMNDSWTWNGDDWAPVVTTQQPPRMGSPALVFDGARRRTVLVGQVAGATHAWEFDGQDWRPAAAAPPCYDGLGYSVARRQVVTTCRDTVSAPILARYFDGLTWTAEVEAAVDGDAGATFTYDARRAALLMYGGTGRYTQRGMRELSLAGWSTGAPAAEGRSRPVLVYDATRGDALLGGGSNFSGVTAGWYLGAGASWRHSNEWVRPNVTELYAAIWAPRWGLVTVTSNYFDLDTHISDGAAWRLLDIPTPEPRCQQAMWLAPLTHHVRMIAGNETTVAVWEFDGAAWSQVPASELTVVGGTCSVAFDTARNRVMVLGQAVGANVWEFDGAGWLQAAPLPLPRPRRGMAIAYDARLQRILAFGGSSDDPNAPVAVEHDDLWGYDGVAWQPLAVGLEAPPPRRLATMAFDPARGTTILYGGEFIYGVRLRDAWEFDGETWTFLAGTDAAPTRAPVLAYDVPGQALHMFGIYDGARTLRTSTDAATEACRADLDVDEDGLNGCDDPDCWHLCTPTCSPAMEAAGSCQRGAPASLGCGDGTCTYYEDARVCPADCALSTVVCGDGFCDPPETTATCANDCGS